MGCILRRGAARIAQHRAASRAQAIRHIHLGEAQREDITFPCICQKGDRIRLFIHGADTSRQGEHISLRYARCHTAHHRAVRCAIKIHAHPHSLAWFALQRTYAPARRKGVGFTARRPKCDALFIERRYNAVGRAPHRKGVGLRFLRSLYAQQLYISGVGVRQNAVVPDAHILAGLYAAFYHVLGAVHTEHILSAACGTEDELSVRGVQYHAFFFFSSLGKHRSRLRVLYGPPSAGPGACLQPQHQHQAQRCCQHRYTSFLHCSQTHICNPSCQTSTVRGILYQCMQKRHMISRRRSIADIVFPL